MVVRISDKTQNYSKVTKLLVKPSFNDDEISAFLRILHSLNEQMESNFNH